MAINLIGIPLFVLLIVSLLGLAVGFIAKKKKLMQVSFIVLVVVILIYFILSFTLNKI